MFLTGTFISALYLSVYSIFKFILHVYLHFYISCSLPLFLSSSFLFVSPVLFFFFFSSYSPLQTLPFSLLSNTLEIVQAHVTFLFLAKNQSFLHGTLALFIESLFKKSMIWVLSMLLRLGCYFQYLSCEKRILLFI